MFLIDFSSLRCSYIVDRLEPAKYKRRAPSKSWRPWSRYVCCFMPILHLQCVLTSLLLRYPSLSFVSLKFTDFHSREDMPDLVVPHHHHPTGLLHIVTMNNEYIEDTWQTHARNLIEEINPSDSVKTFLLFRRLFKVRTLKDILSDSSESTNLF